MGFLGACRGRPAEQALEKEQVAFLGVWGRPPCHRFVPQFPPRATLVSLVPGRRGLRGSQALFSARS